MIEYKKVKIDRKSNLAQIAIEYNIDVKELHQFHNSLCSITEYLPLHLPQLVDVIYLPKEVYEKRTIQLLPKPELILPTQISHKKYGVIIKYPQKDLQIHYTLSVKRQNTTVEITKDKTFINHQEVQRVTEQLFEKAEKALYPLQISLGKKGTLEKIINIEEIQNRWKKEYLPELNSYYVGNVAKEILEILNNGFENLSSKSNFLSHVLFYQLYFSPIYQQYVEKGKQDSCSIYFASLSEMKFYNTTLKLQKEYTRGNKIALQIFGNEEDNIFNKKKKKGKMEFLYKLHKDTHEIFSITGWATTFDDEKEVKIEFEMYEISNS